MAAQQLIASHPYNRREDMTANTVLTYINVPLQGVQYTDFALWICNIRFRFQYE